MSGPAGRIPLLLDVAQVSDDAGFVLTQGVPFPDGAIPRGTPVRVVDEQGTPCPTQGQTLTTWAPDLRFTKWLLVDAQLPGKLSRPGSRLYLEYGPGVEPVSPADPVVVKEDPWHVWVGTGPLELTFRRFQPDFLTAGRVRTPAGWTDLFRGRPGPYLYMKDGRGQRYDSWRAAPAPTITVEEGGPMRASVCVRGFHASDDGRRFCPYVLRIHAYAGRSDLRIFHTFIFDQNPEQAELAAIGMMFPLDLGEDARMAFGGEKEAHWAKFWREAGFMQRSDSEYEVRINHRPHAQGGKTRGWASLCGSTGSAAVALRDLWQEFPKGIALSADGIDVQFWPEAAGHPLKFEVPWKETPISACLHHYPEQILEQCRLRPTAGVNLKGFFGTAEVDPKGVEGNEESIRQAKEFAEEHLKGRIVTYGDTSHGGGAWGLAKTHEFWLRLGAEPLADERAEEWARVVQRPAIAPAEPAYACATGVLGAAHPEDGASFPEVAEILDLMFDGLWAGPVEECRLYGAIDYGDMPNCHLRMAGPVYRIFRNEPGFKITNLTGWHNNEAYDLAYTFMQYAFRTGRRKHWDLAEAYAEHLRDVDTIHAHPTCPDWVGLTHYHNMLHWNGGPSPSHTLVHGWLMHHYLTGDRRSLDVARGAADWALRFQEPCGVVSNRYWGLRREFTSPIANLWAVYQATWEERYGDCARRTLSWFVKTQKPNGAFATDVATDGPRGDQPRVSDPTDPGGGGMEGYSLTEGFRLTQDPAIKESIIACANWFVDSVERGCDLGRDVPSGPAPLKNWKSPLWHMSIPTVVLAEAYRLTGDERYVRPMRDLIEDFPVAGRDWAAMVGRTCWQYAGLAPQVLAAALAAVAESDRRARQG